MLVACWNVNSIRARSERFFAWLNERQPDIVCLQEIKAETNTFPHDECKQQGYHAILSGQRTYNGVAILSRWPLNDICVQLPGDAEDTQARCIMATTQGIRVASLYIPNGSTPDSDKFAYKLRWLERLSQWSQELTHDNIPTLLCGDFNIAHHDRDVAKPSEWQDSVLCTPVVRKHFQTLMDQGWRDTLRQHHPEEALYSWWDYRQLAFPRNDGLRIDYILASPTLAEQCNKAWIDREARKGKGASDHAPVFAEFKTNS